MKTNKFVVILLFAVLLTACSQESSTNTNASSTTTLNPEQKSGGGGGGGGGGREEPTAQKISLNQAEQTQNAPTVIERKIIRNADLSLEVNAPEEAQQKIAAIAEGKNGFVVESTQSSSDVKMTARDTVTMTVRVPAEKFNETLDEIRKTSNRVIIETVKGQDVTEEFIDIEARLKTKKALEEQFLEIMKRSNSVADALNVQRELANVRGEIEQIEGRKRFLENQASLSTIKIKLQSPTAFSANSTGFFYRLKESVGSGFDAALSFILVLVTALIALLPFFLLIVLPIYFVLRYLWRKRGKRNLASAIAREEIKVE
ncbi:MAG: DUF4349 domain-containing protein [Pyrinomonadaceae bacterium]